MYIYIYIHRANISSAVLVYSKIEQQADLSEFFADSSIEILPSGE